MENKKSLSFVSLLPAVLFLLIIGYGGLAVLIWRTVPTLGPRWLFFFLGLLALSGTFLPVVYFLNRRFPSTPPVEGDVILRQAIWFGLYFDILAWLSLGRVLTAAMAVVLAVVLVLIEILLRMWERSRWKPGETA